MALIPPFPIGQPPGSSFLNDWYEKIRVKINTGAITIAFANITGKPTTLAGYGIVDAQSKINNSADLAAALSDETGTGLVVFNNTPSLVAPSIGAATGTSLNITGLVTSGNATLCATSVALTNAAGAAAGTLNNAPTAGNPTKWIQINDNGTIRKIPTWT